MGLKEVLEKMKLVELDSAPAEAPPSLRVTPTSTSAAAPGHQPAATKPGTASSPKDALDEILRQMPAEPPKIDERKLADAAPPAGEAAEGGEIPDFDAVYRAAGVAPPPHGFSAYKVLEILSSPDLGELNPKAKAGVVLSFLKMNPSGPVPIHEVIQDALRRDQALDGFEEFLLKKLDKTRAEAEERNAKLQAEIDEIERRNKEEMDTNRRRVEAEKEKVATWQARKRLEERRLFDAVAPFVEDNPVTVGGAGRPAAPEAPGQGS